MAANRRPPDVSLNLNVRGLGQSATLAINERSRRLRQEGREVFRLGLGQSPFPVPEPVVEALRLHAEKKEYLAVEGLPELREAVAAYHRRTQGIEHMADDVLIGPGSKELMFLLQLVYYGDLVIPTPTWVSYVPQAQIIGRQVRWLSTHAANRWRLTPDELEALCREDPARPRIVILNYPANPTGATYPTEDLKALARIARQYRVVLLSDEIYGELHHRGQHVSIARFYPEGTIVSGGLSKWCGAGGWRLGTFVFPPSLRWLLEGMAAVASETYTSTSAPIQFAAVRAFEGGTRIEDYLWGARRILGALGRRLAKHLVACGARVVDPTGAFYLFPDFGPLADRLEARGIATSGQLADRLLEDTGVATLPGRCFGRPPEELTLRIAYVDFDGARALSVVEHLGPRESLDDGFFRAYCPNMVTACERMCEWLGVSA